MQRINGLFAIEREFDTTTELADSNVMVAVFLGATHKLVKQLLPDESNRAGHADQDVQLAAGGRKTVDLDEVVAVDVGGGVRGNRCRCHSFQVLGAKRPWFTFTMQSYINYLVNTSSFGINFNRTGNF